MYIHLVKSSRGKVEVLVNEEPDRFEYIRAEASSNSNIINGTSLVSLSIWRFLEDLDITYYKYADIHLCLYAFRYVFRYLVGVYMYVSRCICTNADLYR
jgi:hypothetical protein